MDTERTPATHLAHARGRTALDGCIVMGIVNRTPDSFYDGGRMELDASVEHALELIEEGAGLLDLGAVSAGPGGKVDEDEESRRLVPLVEALAGASSVPLSVETARASVAARALDAGAAIINDVTAFTDEAMLGVCAGHGAGLVLVHNGGQVRGRPRNPRYDDVVDDVLATWDCLGAAARGAGIAEEQLVVDAALDFGKTTFHSLELIRRLDEQVASGRPVLVAPSRKDVVGETLDLGVGDRLEGTLALVTIAALKGASIVRVHDVAKALSAVRMAEAVAGLRRPEAPLRGLWD